MNGCSSTRLAAPGKGMILDVFNHSVETQLPPDYSQLIENQGATVTLSCYQDFLCPVDCRWDIVARTRSRYFPGVLFFCWLHLVNHTTDGHAPFVCSCLLLTSGSTLLGGQPLRVYAQLHLPRIIADRQSTLCTTLTEEPQDHCC